MAINWFNCQGRWNLSDDAGLSANGWLDTGRNGNDNHLTVSGSESPAMVTGHGGGVEKAIKRNTSANNYGTLAITDAAQTGLDITGVMTAHIRVRFDSLPGTLVNLMRKYVSSGNQRSYWVYYNQSTNQFGATVSFNGTNVATVISDTTLSIDTWYDLVFVYDGIDLRLYLNSSLDCTPVAHTLGIHNSTSDFFLGSAAGMTISDASIHSEAFSSSDVIEIDSLGDDFSYLAVAKIGQYKLSDDAGNDANGWIDDSDEDNHLTGSGSPTATIGRAEVVDSAVAGYTFRIGANLSGWDGITNGFTIILYTQIDSLAADKNIFQFYLSVGDHRSVWITFNNGSGKFRSITSEDGIATKNIESTLSPSIDTWYRIILQFDADNLYRMKIDDEAWDNYGGTIPSSVYYNVAIPLNVGISASKMDDVSIHTQALDDGDLDIETGWYSDFESFTGPQCNDISLELIPAAGLGVDNHPALLI